MGRGIESRRLAGSRTLSFCWYRKYEASYTMHIKVGTKVTRPLVHELEAYVEKCYVQVGTNTGGERVSLFSAFLVLKLRILTSGRA